MSKQYLSFYINFQGRAREALEFYHKVLGGNLDLQRMQLEADGARILASDGSPDYPAKVGENMALAASGTDKDHIIKIFHDLAEGGRIKMAPAEQPWGTEGWLTDKFGINWLVRVDKA
jgi:PhnB protein